MLIIEFFFLILNHVWEMLLRYEAIWVRHVGWVVVFLWWEHILVHGHLLLEGILVLVVLVDLYRVWA